MISLEYLKEDKKMGEFATPDLIVEGLVAIGSFGFFFLAFQALRLLKR